MLEGSPGLWLLLSIGGIASGLGLLWRGMGGYRTAVALGDTSTSAIDSLAAGEVRVTGTIEAAEATLVSPLQSRPCVWYKASVRARDHEGGDVFAEERAVGFRLRDAGGAIRVFPRGARVGVSARFSERTRGFGDDLPAGYQPRSGSMYGPPGGPTGDADGDGTLDPVEREAAIAALLTVRAPDPIADPGATYGTGGREFEEARLELGDVITIVGTALPFGHLADPTGADWLDHAGDPLAGLDDPLVAADVAEARAAGRLTTPEEAWGNAAIPGFGIGKPVRAPELDPDAIDPVLAPEQAAADARARFDILPDTLVIAAAEGSPLLIAEGAPEAAVAREQGRFLVGLLGGVLAVGSAIVGAVALGGLTT